MFPLANRWKPARRAHLCAFLLCAMVSLKQISQQALASRQPYDPEQQDGIPVFLARSIPKQQHDDDWETAGSGRQTAPSPPRLAQRRQADSDLDEGSLEDEDEDEYKSGSSPRETIENPSYGESRRAARDADEIEHFFDKHLGPAQETAGAGAGEGEGEGSASERALDVPATDPDTDDQYEAAASSPLSNIFHSLLSHTHADHKHKRPFIQIAATSGADPEAPAGPTSKEKASSAAAAPSPGPPAGTIKASQSAQSFVETAPIALAFTPISASTQTGAQEAGGQEPQDAAGLREIYIGRRPTVLKYLQQVQPGHTTAGSSNVWRGSPAAGQAAYEQGQSSDYAGYPMAASYAYPREQYGAASSTGAPSGPEDEQTVTYGLSFGGAPSADEDLGGSSAAQDDQPSGSPMEANNEQQEQPYQQPQSYVPYSTRYSTSSTRAHNYYNNAGQHQSGPHYRLGYTRVLPQQQHQHQHGQQQQQMVMVTQQPLYHQYPRGGSTRYHRDPSESTNSVAGDVRPMSPQQHYYTGYQQAEVAQYRGANGNKQRAHDDEADETSYGTRQRHIAERQQLLAAMDREIKANPRYRNNNAAATTSAQTTLYANRLEGRPSANRHHLVAIKAVKKSYKGDDLDSYNSFHSEMDPFKTFTSTSRMINDPTSFQVPANRQVPIQSGSDRIPATDSSYHAAINSSINNRNQEKQFNTNLLTGPLTNYDKSSRKSQTGSQQGDLLRNNDVEASAPGQVSGPSQIQGQDVPNSRVRREDSDEREVDNDVDDDGVWVDDDEDDDGRQQSSDVNETAQDPESGEEEDGGQQDAASSVPIAHNRMNPPGVIGGPHGYELSPNDLMIYHG